ncbi:MAG: hypothetical protein ACTH1D_09490 [Mycobacteriaceae bacterium]|uniref:hypothetical protein n=1 Tax=Corynebacterium sp. TaxID=1720 RepID=UPI003F9E5B42
MAHYDIYRSLGLDRSSPTGDLASELDRRIASVPQDDPAAREELTVARSILGDDGRRSLYDQRIGDPDAPDIDIDSLRQLASLNPGGDGQAAAAQPAGGGKGQQFQRHAVREVRTSFKQSRGLAIGVTAVATALVVGVAGWAFGLFGGGDEYKDARDTVGDLLDNDSEDDLRSWVQDNSTYQDRDSVISALQLDGDGSFNGLDALFGGSDLTASDVVTTEQLRMSTPEWNEDDWYEDLEDEGYTRDEIDSMLLVGVSDQEDSVKGAVLLIERDGDYQVTDVNTL